MEQKSTWHMYNISVHDDLLDDLISSDIGNYWKRRYYIDISHLLYTKHFFDDFLHEQLMHLPFEHEQVAIIGLMLSGMLLSIPLRFQK